MTRQLICEGWMNEDYEGGLVLVPDVAYCVQGSKVWFAEGAEPKRQTVCESVGSDHGLAMTVVESIDQLELVETTLSNGTVTMLPKDGKWFVEGIGQRSGVKNVNKRTYAKSIWERIIGDDKSTAQKNITERGMVGHLEHPADGRTNGKELALVTVKAKLNEDGTVWAKHELLDTPNGQILQELTRKNVRWGVSTRGSGTIHEDGRVDEEDYNMECWDAVVRPSTPGAYTTLSPGKPGAKAKTTEAVDATATVVESIQDPVIRQNLSELILESVAARMAAIGLPAETTDYLLGRNGQAADAALTQADVWARARFNLVEAVAPKNEQQTVAESTVTRTVDDATQGSVDTSIELRDQLAQVTAEAEDLRAEVTTLRGRLTVAEATRDESYRLVESAETDLLRTAQELKTMTEALAHAKAQTVSDLPAIVEAALKSNPGLRPYRTLLAEAETASELTKRLDELIPLVQATAKTILESVEEPAPKASQDSMHLPFGMVVESAPASVTTDSGVARPRTAGSRAAAKIISAAKR